MELGKIPKVHTKENEMYTGGAQIIKLLLFQFFIFIQKRRHVRIEIEKYTTETDHIGTNNRYHIIFYLQLLIKRKMYQCIIIPTITSPHNLYVPV